MVPMTSSLMTISQVETFQRLATYVRPSEVQEAAMGAKRCGQEGLGGASDVARTDWEVATWEIEHLGSCHLVKYPWEVAA